MSVPQISLSGISVQSTGTSVSYNKDYYKVHYWFVLSPWYWFVLSPWYVTRKILQLQTDEYTEYALPVMETFDIFSCTQFRFVADAIH